MLQKTKSFEGQSLFDVCLMTYGSLEYMYKLIQDNNIDSINENNLSQKEFTFDTSLINDSLLYSKNINTNTVYSTKVQEKMSESSFYLTTEVGDYLKTEGDDYLIL